MPFVILPGSVDLECRISECAEHATSSFDLIYSRLSLRPNRSQLHGDGYHDKERWFHIFVGLW